MGVGGAPLYTLGMAFIDENVSHKMQPVYSGKLYSKRVFLSHFCNSVFDCRHNN